MGLSSKPDNMLNVLSATTPRTHVLLCLALYMQYILNRDSIAIGRDASWIQTSPDPTATITSV